MKTHVLSRYSEGDCKKKSLGYINKEHEHLKYDIVSDNNCEIMVEYGITIETRTKEDSDPDEFLIEPTNLTKSIETSDPDEFILGPTILTENVENSDVDELCYCMGPTIKTFSEEISDPDEFLINYNNQNLDKDFDNILLL